MEGIEITLCIFSVIFILGNIDGKNFDEWLGFIDEYIKQKQENNKGR